MRLEKLQAYLQDKGQEYQYTEEDGCGSIDWEHRGLMYHAWEFPESCAESNVRIAGKMEEGLNFRQTLPAHAAGQAEWPAQAAFFLPF